MVQVANREPVTTAPSAAIATVGCPTTAADEPTTSAAMGDDNQAEGPVTKPGTIVIDGPTA